jgi:hypothetical protein
MCTTNISLIASLWEVVVDRGADHKHLCFYLDSALSNDIDTWKGIPD